MHYQAMKIKSTGLWLLRLALVLLFFECSLSLIHIHRDPRPQRTFLSTETFNDKESSIKIALTREKGENGKLGNLLSRYQCEEIPCIEFALTDEAFKLTDLLSSSQFDLIVITSPQSATTFLKYWRLAGEPMINIASVGKGTSKVLQSHNLNVRFEPTEATGEALSTQLPLSLAKRVLYPCSQLADNKIENILHSRGFQCQRLSTYTTVPAIWSDDQLQRATQVDLVTFASPSTIKVWAERVGTRIPAVTIGPTSEKAAIKAGFEHVFSPKEGSQGLEAWAHAVHLAIEALKISK